MEYVILHIRVFHNMKLLLVSFKNQSAYFDHFKLLSLKRVLVTW